MTNEEARNILLTSVHPQTSEEAEAIGIAVKAVERMIPREPIKTPDEGYRVLMVYAQCPVCNSGLGHIYKDDHKSGYVTYCENCGQAIDWSEKE